MFIDALKRDNKQDIQYCITTFSNPDHPMWQTKWEQNAACMFQAWWLGVIERVEETDAHEE